MQEDFDDDTLLLGGDDDLLGSEETPAPPETILEESAKPTETSREPEEAKPSEAIKKSEVEPEPSTLTEEPCSESDDDGGDVQVSHAFQKCNSNLSAVKRAVSKVTSSSRRCLRQLRSVVRLW